jgi:predicted lactoylglutathione lyase
MFYSNLNKNIFRRENKYTIFSILQSSTDFYNEKGFKDNQQLSDEVKYLILVLLSQNKIALELKSDFDEFICDLEKKPYSLNTSLEFD